MYFAKNVSEDISKILNGKYSQKLLHHAKNMHQMHIKVLEKKSFKKKPEATGDLISNEIADVVTKSYDGKIKKVSKNSWAKNSEIVTNENDQ